MKRIIFIILSITGIDAKEVKPKFYTPSFNCSTFNKNSVEYKICTNKELSKLDFKMSKLYHKIGKLQIGKKYSPIFINQQREWLKIRNDCLNINCLKKKYREKINYLKKYKILNIKQFIQMIKKFAISWKNFLIMI